MEKGKGFVITVNVHKGGTGKSTTVINLAIEAAHRGLKTVVIDGDTTKTSDSHFSDRNSENEDRQAAGKPLVPFVKCEYYPPDRNIKPVIEHLKTDYDLIIVDTMGGRGDDSKGGQGNLFLSVIQHSDIILIPVQTDLKAMRQIAPTLSVITDIEDRARTFAGYEDFKFDTRILFNQVKPGTKAHRDALDMVKDLRSSLTFCTTTIPYIEELKSFDTNGRGLALVDIKHPKRACYQLLLDELLREV